jgi:hypothetical protein
MDMAGIVRGLERLDAMLRSSGRRFYLVVPPDKSTFESANLPDDYPDRGCAVQAHRRRVAALRRLGLPGFVDVEAALAARRRREGAPIYLPDDTHWTESGAVAYGTAVARAIDPRLLAHTRAIRRPDGTNEGDLGRLSGDPKLSRVEKWELVREGVSLPRVESRHYYANGDVVRDRRRSTPGKARLYPGPAVLYGDSFTGVSLDKIVPFFADVTRPPELGLAANAGRLPQMERLMIEAILRSRTLIYERVERDFWGTRTGNLLRASFLDQLERALAAR